MVVKGPAPPCLLLWGWVGFLEQERVLGGSEKGGAARLFGVVVLLGGFSARQGQSFKKLAIDFARGLVGNRLSLRWQIPEWRQNQPLSVWYSIGNAMSALPPPVAWSGGSNTSAVGGDITRLQSQQRIYLCR